MEFLNKIRKSSNTQVGSGIKWNLFSLVFLVIAGMVFNLLIAKIYDAEVFGYYSVAFSWYTAMSQATVFGIHFSVLKYISEYSKDDVKCNKIIGSALAAVLTTSIIISCIFFVIVLLLSKAYNDPTLVSLLRAIPALVFFAINKVLLNFYNGKSKMKEYAVFQSLRNVLLMAAFIIIVGMKLDGTYLTLCFLISEGSLFLIISVYTLFRKYINFKVSFSWIKEHIRFGLRIMPSSLVVDLNFRTDILCLRFLGINYNIIGGYSFAINFAQGFYQLLVVIRRNINPKITQYYSNKDFDRFEDLKKTIKKYVPLIISILSVVLVVGYVLICKIIGKPEYLNATFPLVIILISMSINSYYTCFGNTLNQFGLPKQESILNIVTLGSNFILNMAFISLFGIYGAATATAVSYFVFSTTLYQLVKRKGKYELNVSS